MQAFHKFAISIFLISLFTACTYDKLENRIFVCDTINVSYTANVKPILKTNCYRCHSLATNSGSGGIEFETYSKLAVLAKNGYLYGDIAHLGFPYNNMPADGGKLSPCEIQIIKKWIDQGYPNN